MVLLGTAERSQLETVRDERRTEAVGRFLVGWLARKTKAGVTNDARKNGFGPAVNAAGCRHHRRVR